MNIKQIVSNFNIDGDFLAYNPYGNGHINDTFCLTFKNENKIERFILQRINDTVFPDVGNLMHNVVLVTEFLHKKIAIHGGDPLKETITYIKTRDGKSFFTDEEKSNWRVMILIENTEAYQIAVDTKIFETTGNAFGSFIRMLEDFPVDKLTDIIPNFHNTVVRFNTFKQSLKANAYKRRRYCREEVRFVMSYEDKCSHIVNLLATGEIPTRVTHNDTKINNILMDEQTGEAVCVIDLDTIMPGSLLYDFGDAIRSGCNTGMEDERDLSKVSFDIEMFTCFAKGFIDGIGTSMTKIEKDNLAYAAMIITLECGMRFLTDYLRGDIYFKVNYSNHNLVRAKTQFKLVSEMNRRLDEMNAIIQKL